MSRAGFAITFLYSWTCTFAIAGISHHVKEAAPELGISELLQAPTGAKADWKSLRGKVVVVEFWATWCSACTRQIPHLNALADQVKDDPIVFISVTDEDRETVERFLKTHPMRGWIAINAPASTYGKYGVDSRPLTYVVGPDGIIDAKLDPFLQTNFPIQAQNLRNLLAGKPSGLVTTPRLIYAGQVTDSDGKPVAGVEVHARSRKSPTSWAQMGDSTTTDADGRFRIEREHPINEYPVFVDFTHPSFLYAHLEDLRLLPAEQLANLHITLQDGNTFSGHLVNDLGQAAGHATVRAVFSEQRDYDKAVETDADGKFEFRGLPLLKGELRVITGRSNQILRASTPIDLTSPQAAPVKLEPVLRADAQIDHLLGMKLTAASEDLQHALWLDASGIMVVDPGPDSRRLGMGTLFPGDCIRLNDNGKPIGSVAALARLLLKQYNTPDSKGHVLLDGQLQSAKFGFTNISPYFEPTLSESDLSELKGHASDH